MKQELNQQEFQILKTPLDQTQQLNVLVFPLIVIENEFQKDVLSILSNFLSEYGNYTIMNFEEEYFKGSEWMLQTNENPNQQIIDSSTFIKKSKQSFKGLEHYCIRFITEPSNQNFLHKKVMKCVQVVKKINDQLKQKMNESVERLYYFVKSLNL